MLFEERCNKDTNSAEWIVTTRSGSTIYYAYRNHNGKKEMRSLGTTDELKAHGLVATMIQDENAINREEYTVQDALADYYRVTKDRVTHPKKLFFSLRHLSRYFGNLRADKVGVDIWLRYEKIRGVKTSTLRNDRIKLLAALNLAYKRGLIERKPHIPRPPHPVLGTRTLTREEAQRILDVTKAPHCKLLFNLLLYTGCRQGAALSLTWDRVDFQKRNIDFRIPGKPMWNKRRTVVPMGSKLLEAMMEAYNERTCEHVISFRNRPVKYPYYSFRRARIRAGLGDDVTIPVLRRTAATWLAEGGVPIADASALLACRIDTLQAIYIKYSSDHLRRASDVLEGNVDKWVDPLLPTETPPVPASHAQIA